MIWHAKTTYGNGKKAKTMPFKPLKQYVVPPLSYDPQTGPNVSSWKLMHLVMHLEQSYHKNLMMAYTQSHSTAEASNLWKGITMPITKNHCSNIQLQMWKTPIPRCYTPYWSPLWSQEPPILPRTAKSNWPTISMDRIPPRLWLPTQIHSRPYEHHCRPPVPSQRP